MFCVRKTDYRAKIEKSESEKMVVSIGSTTVMSKYF